MAVIQSGSLIKEVYVPVTSRLKELDSHKLPEPTLLDKIKKIKLNIFKIFLRGGISLSLLGLVACNGTPTPIIDATGTPALTTSTPEASATPSPRVTVEQTATPDSDPIPGEGFWMSCQILPGITGIDDNYVTGEMLSDGLIIPFIIFSADGENIASLVSVDTSPGDSEHHECLAAYWNGNIIIFKIRFVNNNGDVIRLDWEAKEPSTYPAIKTN